MTKISGVMATCFLCAGYPLDSGDPKMYRAWQDYPRDQLEFESHFASEEACRDYLFACAGQRVSAVPRCGHERAWPVRKVWFECARAGGKPPSPPARSFKTHVAAAAVVLGDVDHHHAGMGPAPWSTARSGTGQLPNRLDLDAQAEASDGAPGAGAIEPRRGRETYWGAEEEGVIGRQTERKALIAVAAEERGTGLGRIRMQRVQRLGGSLMPFVEESASRAAWLLPTTGRATIGYQRRIISINNRREQASQLLPGCTWRSRYSSAGCWARIRGRSATSSGLLSRRVRVPLHRRRSRSRGKLFYRLVQGHGGGAAPYRSSSPIGTLRRCGTTRCFT